MPRFANTEFLADPVGFMSSNIVLPYGTGLGMTQGDARIKEVVIKSYDNKQGSQLGNPIDVWCLRQKLPMDPPEEGFYAYWAPYQRDKTLSCMLGNGARFMFTDTMDGCTFGIGAYASDGVCRVAHANEASLGSQLETAGVADFKGGQRTVQRIKLSQALDPTMSAIGPPAYMRDVDGQEVLKSTTWGIHELGQNWSFHTVRYWINPAGKYFLRQMTQQV